MEPYVNDPDIVLSWTGSDPTPGTGVAGYDLQHRLEDGPWGNILEDSPQTGMTHHGVEGTHTLRVRARDRAGNVGAYSAETTVVPEPGNPQDWNRYAYVANNPIRSTDPSGHFIFNRPNWMYFVPGLNAVAYAKDCATSVSQAIEAYEAGERRVGALAMHATGATDALIRQAESVDRLNEDVDVVFSNAPIGERVPHAIHLGGWATGKAAQIVGLAQLARSTTINVRAGISSDPSLPPGTGRTDKLGNITVSSRGTSLQQTRVLNHERVHRFFTPRGPFRGIRADFNMLAYRNSHLLRYIEEAAAESFAQVTTGGSLREGLVFPIRHGYVTPWRVLSEAIGVGGVLAGTTSIAESIIEE